MGDHLSGLTVASIQRAAKSIDELKVDEAGKELDLWK